MIRTLSMNITHWLCERAAFQRLSAFLYGQLQVFATGGAAIPPAISTLTHQKQKIRLHIAVVAIWGLLNQVTLY